MPRKEPLHDADVIATREYVVEGADPPETVRVRLAMPRPTSDGRFECGAEVANRGEVWVWPMNGVDALQAMILAISMIETDLQLIARHRSGRLLWSGSNDDGLGLLDELLQQSREGDTPET
jgi:hypothetical protein